MSPDAAFSSAAGTATNTVALIAVGVIACVIFLWGAWAIASVYLGWARERVGSDIFQRAIIRIVLLMLVTLWVVL